MKVQQEKKRAKFRISFIFLFIIASFAACFTFYMKEDFDVEEALKEEQNSNDIVVSVVNRIKEEDKTEAVEKVIVNPVQASEKVNASYFERILFVGDERAEGLFEYRVLPEENVCSDANISISAMDMSIADKAKGKDAVYIMAGMNNLDLTVEDEAFEAFGNFVDKLRESAPETDIYLVSLLPITGRYEKNGVTNSQIDAYNSSLLRFANENGLYYLDMNTEFVGNDGKMPEAFTKDGYELSKDICEEIGTYILTHTYTEG